MTDKRQEGYQAYLSGENSWDNPYCGYDNEDDPSYFLWYDGWMQACSEYERN